MAGNEEAIECAKCKIDFDGDKVIGCEGWCKEWFHLKCVGVSENDFMVISQCKGLKWYCNMCYLKSEVKLKDFLEDVIKKETKDIKELIKINKPVLNKDGQGEKATYAESVEGLMVTKKEVLIVKSKMGKTNDPNVVEKTLKDALNPAELKIGINSFKRIHEGKIAIACDNTNDLKKLQGEIDQKLGNQLDTVVSKRVNPKIKITGLNVEIERNQLKTCIINQNRYINGQNAILDVKSIYKGKYAYTAIMEVDGESFNEIMKRGILKIEWSICKVFEYVNIMRCFKCCGFYHKAINCRNNVVCGNCGDGNHETKDCTDKENLKCVNCLTVNQKYNLKYHTNHRAYDTNCEVLKKKVEQHKKRVEYEEAE